MLWGVLVFGRDVGTVEHGELEAVLEGSEVELLDGGEVGEEGLVQQVEADIATSLSLCNVSRITNSILINIKYIFMR